MTDVKRMRSRSPEQVAVTQKQSETSGRGGRLGANVAGGRGKYIEASGKAPQKGGNQKEEKKGGNTGSSGWEFGGWGQEPAGSNLGGGNKVPNPRGN